MLQVITDLSHIICIQPITMQRAQPGTVLQNSQSKNNINSFLFYEHTLLSNNQIFNEHKISAYTYIIMKPNRAETDSIMMTHT